MPFSHRLSLTSSTGSFRSNDASLRSTCRETRRTRTWRGSGSVFYRLAAFAIFSRSLSLSGFRGGRGMEIWSVSKRKNNFERIFRLINPIERGWRGLTVDVHPRLTTCAYPAHNYRRAILVLAPPTDYQRGTHLSLRRLWSINVNDHALRSLSPAPFDERRPSLLALPNFIRESKSLGRNSFSRVYVTVRTRIE